MWTNKELVLISLATGLVFCFATIYTQNKFHQYIDNKVTEKSSNPLESLIATGTMGLGQMGTATTPAPIQQQVVQETQQQAPTPGHKKMFHDPPPGSGERWTPLEITT